LLLAVAAELLTDPNQLAQYAQNTAKAKRKAEDLSKYLILFHAHITGNVSVNIELGSVLSTERL